MKRQGLAAFLMASLAAFGCGDDGDGDGAGGTDPSGLSGTGVDSDGDGAIDSLDTDGDGVGDIPLIDTDGDGEGDTADTDGDGVGDTPIDSGTSTGTTTGASTGTTTGTSTGTTTGTSTGSEPVCEQTLCDADCVDVETDNDHCGACDNSCGQYEECQTGSCIVIGCADPLDLCGQECVNLQNDEGNCGGCGEACDLSYACQTAECACTGGKTECLGRCTFVSHDRQNCGGCGVPCSDDEACVSGDCQTIGIPEETYCDLTDSWNADYTTLEFLVLDEVNKRRAEGADCNSEGVFAPTGPLQMEESLRCAARVHTYDMVDRNYFSHYTEGTNADPGDRLRDAGYDGGGWGENISAGRSSATAVVAGWMASDGHCSNIMNPNYTLLGVGYMPGGAADYGHYWTQTFGR